MKSSESCRECKTIADELAIANKQAWDTADPATRHAWAAIYKMNTEDDVEWVVVAVMGE